MLSKLLAILIRSHRFNLFFISLFWAFWDLLMFNFHLLGCELFTEWKHNASCILDLIQNNQLLKAFLIFWNHHYCLSVVGLFNLLPPPATLRDGNRKQHRNKSCRIFFFLCIRCHHHSTLMDLVSLSWCGFNHLQDLRRLKVFSCQKPATV